MVAHQITVSKLVHQLHLDKDDTSIHLKAPKMETELAEAKKKYDFLRFTFIDIHGIGRSKTVSKSSFDKFFKNGAQFGVGCLGLGFNGEQEVCNKVNSQLKATNFQFWSNVTAFPVSGTLHPLSAEKDKTFHVGEILCETFHSATGMRQEENPRYIATKQIARLQTLGYEVHSAFELEFMLVTPKTLQPIFYKAGEMFSSLVQSRFDYILLDIMSQLEAIGIDVETVQSEFSDGQFEIALKPQLGISIADNLFVARNCIKDIAMKHNLKAIFMTERGAVHISNGLHYNHSLRKIKGGDDLFAFCDKADSLGLSDVCHRWLGGLIRHFRAMNSICSPTFNCYRRLDKLWAPCYSGWGIDNRMESYRVKNFSPEETFIETRLPSGSSNPYLVLAVTIAAGIDGLENQLPCPPPSPLPLTVSSSDIYTKMESSKVPLTLGEALTALEEDTYIVKTLGKDFVKWFILLKEAEINLLAGCDVMKNEPEMLARERDLYMDLL